jgi:hypothetical protein
MIIKEGCYYKNRNGDVFRAGKAKSKKYKYRMYDINGQETPYTVTENGEWGHASVKSSDMDIVEEITPDKHPEYFI